MVSIEQIADYFAVSKRTVQRWRDEKDFPEPAFRRRQVVRYDWDDVLDFKRRNPDLGRESYDDAR